LGTKTTYGFATFIIGVGSFMVDPRVLYVNASIIIQLLSPLEFLSNLRLLASAGWPIFQSMICSHKPVRNSILCWLPFLVFLVMTMYQAGISIDFTRAVLTGNR